MIKYCFFSIKAQHWFKTAWLLQDFFHKNCCNLANSYLGNNITNVALFLGQSIDKSTSRKSISTSHFVLGRYAFLWSGYRSTSWKGYHCILTWTEFISDYEMLNTRIIFKLLRPIFWLLKYRIIYHSKQLSLKISIIA